jgi:uncharacterized alpha-E superfamily protein
MLSRVADSLYWMSRYLERAEHVSRLLAVRLDTATEQREQQAVRSWRRFAASLWQPVPDALTLSPFAIADSMTRGQGSRVSILHYISGARDNARQVREQISAEMWERLNLLYLSLRSVEFSTVWRNSPADFYNRVVHDLYLFHGITDSTLRHGEGWHFIQLGRYIERAQLLARLLDVHFGRMPSGVPADLEECDHIEWFALLRACSGFEAYCKVQTADVRPEAIAEFLIFDPLFPRALRFAVDGIASEVAHIGRGPEEKRDRGLSRLTGRLKAKLDYGQVDEVLAGESSYLNEVHDACGAIHRGVYETFIDYGVDAVVAA